MKLYRSFLLIACCFLTIALSAQTNRFDYQRKISGITKEDWYSVDLPSDIFKNLNRDFSDIRILTIANDTTEVPYLLRINTDDLREELVNLPVKNISWKNGVLFMTFQLQKAQHVNYLDLKFQEDNFFGFGKIEGSNDQKEWYVIAEKQRILSINNATANYQVSTINFNYTDYRYLRVSVQADTKLNLISASFKNQTLKQGVYNTIASTFKISHDKKLKQSLITVKLNDYVPVTNLKLDLKSNSDYYRQVSIEYLNDSIKTEKGWLKNYQNLTSDYATSFTPNEYTFTYEFTNELRIIIYNQDNPPLSIERIDVQGPVVQLISKLSPGNNVLTYGNKRAAPPAYDINYFTEKIPAQSTPAKLDIEETLRQPSTESALIQNKAYLWVIMGATIAVLGFFTLRMMKNK